MSAAPALKPAFDTVLIANRGAIATRIIRTLRKMGLRSVAVYSEADKDSLHVVQADEAVCIGGARASESYLNVEAILAAAKATGAGAIHPGYGFLAENVDFAEACAAAGIVFIGPTGDNIRTFGLKHTARALAEAHGLPLAPGTGLLTDEEEAAKAAAAIGYPVMLKATAGGGGIGMRVCEDEAAVRAATPDGHAVKALGPYVLIVAARGEARPQPIEDGAFGDRVDRRRGVVEHQYPRCEQ